MKEMMEEFKEKEMLIFQRERTALKLQDEKKRLLGLGLYCRLFDLWFDESVI